MKGICINDKFGEKTNGELTEGKEYSIKQAQHFEDYYELINNKGVLATYKKERFKIVEGEKMEDKTIRVTCTDRDIWSHLTKGKEYEVIEETEKKYKIVDDAKNCTYYSKKLFEEVKEDVLMVECIDNSIVVKDLTLNKKYKMIEEKGDFYLIEDDKEELIAVPKTIFKPVPKEKEIKCYNKECQHNKENTCNIPSVTVNCGCNARLKEPINYEEEYNKLKIENSKLQIRINNQNVIIQEYEGYKKENFGLVDKVETMDDEYQVEIEELKKKFTKIVEDKNEEIKNLNDIVTGKDNKIQELYQRIDRKNKEIEILQGESNSFEKIADEYRKKKEARETDLIKYEGKIKSLKEVIKKLSELL